MNKSHFLDKYLLSIAIAIKFLRQVNRNMFTSTKHDFFNLIRKLFVIPSFWKLTGPTEISKPFLLTGWNILLCSVAAFLPRMDHQKNPNILLFKYLQFTPNVVFLCDLIINSYSSNRMEKNIRGPVKQWAEGAWYYAFL